MALIEIPSDKKALAKAIMDDKTIKAIKVLSAEQATRLLGASLRDWRYVVLIK